MAAKAKKAKKSVRVEKYTKIVMTVRRAYDYLSDAVSSSKSLNTTWGNDNDISFVRKGDFLFCQVDDCDETFRIPISGLKELVEAVDG